MLVVDASAVVDLLLDTPAGLKVRIRIRQSNETLHAPHLLDLEVANALRRIARVSGLSDAQAEKVLLQLAALPLRRYPRANLIARVWTLRDSLSAYDAVYAALAESLDALLLTTDGKLARAHGHHAEVDLVEA